jgi:MGT family glycosyltransferase
MRYLLAIWDGGGATPPNLGIARLLVSRGHEVVVYGDPTLAADVIATGAVHRTWPSAPQRASTSPEDDVLKDWEARTPIGAFLRVRDRLISGPAARFATDIVTALDAESFDAVLADGVLLGVVIGAEARGIPVVALLGAFYLVPSRVRPITGGIPPARGPLSRMRDRVGFTLANRLWDGGLRSLNEARAEFGLPPVRHLWDQLHHASRVLVLTASALDDPPPDAPTVRYVGPVLEDISAEREVQLPLGDAPLVVVGASSTYMKHQVDLLRRIAEALSSLDVRGVITTGPAIDPAEVPASPNVVVVRTAPHRELFTAADLVITHAGHGTLIKSITAGVPTLCIPLGRDQPGNAARAARHGVAVALSPRATPAVIAQSVQRMLDEPSFRAKASALGERIRAEIASGVLVAELEGAAGAARPRR